ncbi:MAG TPA: type II toxin-antitoxin system RelE/ParE family toxin [Rhodanobacteraceae bacterium]
MAIKTFRSNDTRDLFAGKRIRRWAGIEAVAMRKLAMLSRAALLDDLRVPPGNRLEAMKGDRKGQYSVRVNDQWRVCFVWTGTDAEAVEIVDYH